MCIFKDVSHHPFGISWHAISGQIYIFVFEQVELKSFSNYRQFRVKYDPLMLDKRSRGTQSNLQRFLCVAAKPTQCSLQECLGKNKNIIQWKIV